MRLKVVFGYYDKQAGFLRHFLFIFLYKMHFFVKKVYSDI